MARFRAIGAFIIGDRKYPAGTIFCDVATGIPGDVVYGSPGSLTAATVGPNLVPLDAAAQAMMAASRFANEQRWVADGANSIS